MFSKHHNTDNIIHDLETVSLSHFEDIPKTKLYILYCDVRHSFWSWHIFGPTRKCISSSPPAEPEKYCSRINILILKKTSPGMTAQISPIKIITNANEGCFYVWRLKYERGNGKRETWVRFHLYRCESESDIPCRRGSQRIKLNVLIEQRQRSKKKEKNRFRIHFHVGFLSV